MLTVKEGRSMCRSSARELQMGHTANHTKASQQLKIFAKKFLVFLGIHRLITRKGCTKLINFLGLRGI